VRQLAEHYHKSHNLIIEEELRQYFLFSRISQTYSRGTMTIAICGLSPSLNRRSRKEWTTFNIVRSAPEECAKTWL
jgi:hypothetical protein